MMETINIKSEPQEFEYIKPVTLKADKASVGGADQAQCMAHLKSRCGEIFVTKNARSWTFTCSYCDKTTRDIGEFICHIQFKHLHGQYTEQDDNGDNADEPHTREAAYTEDSFNNQEQNILFPTQRQTNDPSPTTPLNTPATGQVTNNTLTFENSTNLGVSSLANSNNTLTYDADSNFECSASTNSDEELNFNAATSQENSNFTTATTSQIIIRGKRRKENPMTKATPEQLHYFVNFCTLHPELVSNCAEDNAKRIELWEVLANDLNAIRGPTRSASKWISNLTHWRVELPSQLQGDETRRERLKEINPPPEDENSFYQFALNVSEREDVLNSEQQQQQEYENIISDLDSNSTTPSQL